MEKFKDKYEISIWEDVMVPSPAGTTGHYEEELIGVIGSDTLTAEWRAVEPKLVENINGTNTFSFKMFYTYTDTVTGEKIDNPFMKLLVNERKVKVNWKNRWYDFVIKNIVEDSSGKSITYTCQDQFINELSKTGFNLEFADELNNNIGTVEELANKVVDGTDWQIGNCDNLVQKREEPVYEITQGGKTFLVFYSVVQNKESYFQYWYSSSNQYERDGTSMLVINGQCYGSGGAIWSGDSVTTIIDGTSMTINFSNRQVSDRYRAERIVRTQVSDFCKALDRYVYKYTYKDNNNTKTAYGYQTTSYIDPSLVENYIVNGSGFINTNGWVGSGVNWAVYPKYDTDPSADMKNYLTAPKAIWVKNASINDYAYRFPNGFVKGEKYVFRVRAKQGSNEAPDNDVGTNFLVKISQGSLGRDKFVETRTYDSSTGWTTFIMTCITSVSQEELSRSTDTVGLWMQYTNTGDSDYVWILEAEFFKYVKTNDDKILTPGDFGKDGVVQVEYRYFDEKYLTYSDASKIKYLTQSNQPSSEYTPVYNQNNEKRRTITGKNSNRFNWIQTIAETFECWARFNIEHENETGKLIYENGVPKKTITFVENVGEETNVGFYYGVDLNTISRTINSDAIATKVIVSPNSNEFAQDGFCTIARASENYSKSNFILDFGYYINQGMLSSAQVNLDLYDSSGLNGIGYYFKLRQFNIKYDEITEELADLKSVLDRYNSLLETYSTLVTSTQQEKQNLESTLQSYVGGGTFNYSKVRRYISDNPDFEYVQTLWATRPVLINDINKYNAIKATLTVQTDNLKTVITTKEREQSDKKEEIEGLDKEFYNKYSRYIQEGSWISEDYYDDNLYYLDAESVAYTSSRPQIQYNINVLRLSALEEYKNKVFNLGDIAFIQDTEFFGYVIIDGKKTPYKEKIVITEITSNFDSPENDIITVQNYKTQFEDLFQRITATTQSLQYSTGAYNRAASIVEPTGVINSWTLEKSFEYNEQLAWSAKDDSVSINSSGITLIDKTDPQKMVRISSYGIQISKDGGLTWTLGVTGEGVSTQTLTSGAINTDNIQILSGSYPTFKWNKYGLNAYYYTTTQEGAIENVWSNKFVRFDRYGIYGIDAATADAGEVVFNSENAIWDAAQYALTWKGFMLKTQGGAVTITSEDDITVKDDENEVRIKIGRISGQGTVSDPYIYGLLIKDASGASVIRTDDTGRLWLSDRLNIGSANSGYQVGIGKLSEFVYIKTQDNTPVQGKIYYYIDDQSGNYVEFTGGSFDPNVTYFERNHEVMNANGNFIVYEDGSMVATNGTFSGDITGATGTFSGAINATIGYVGGFVIGDKTLISSSGSLVLRGAEDFYETTDVEPQEDKTYYYIDGQGNYIEFDGAVFDSGTTYYEKTREVINSSNNFIVYDDGSILANNGVFNNGVFNGIINATDGVFNGTIIANNGTIGGFTINEKNIYNNDLTLKAEGYFKTIDQSFFPEKTYYEYDEGSDSYVETTDTQKDPTKTYYEYNPRAEIQVEYITLGTGATIKDYIELGSAKIQNPDNYNHVFVTAGNGTLEILDTGIIKLGDININGTTSRLELNGNNATIIAGDNVSITPNRSVFNNVDITGTLHTAVFETGKIQTVGGAMIFKESAEIDTISSGQNDNEYIFTTKTNINLENDSIVLFIGGDTEYNLEEKELTSQIQVYGKIINKSVSNDVITYIVETDSSISEANTVIQIGDKSGNDYTNNLIIGINSQSSRNKMLYPEALTMVSFDKINEYTPEFKTPNLLLGKLDDLNIEGISGFGLYGENVYLTGSLVTQVGNNSYAGVNTFNGVTATIFGTGQNDDQSRIVFWGGADSNKDEDIRNAKFQVTENGSIYASQGIFEGAIITKSSIQAASLYATHIYGGTENTAAALNVHDTTNGIVFYSDRNDSEMLRINGSGFSYNSNNNQFIEIHNPVNQQDLPYIQFKGDYYIGKVFETEQTLYNQNYYNLIMQNYKIESYQKVDDNLSTPIGKLEFNDKGILQYLDSKIELTSDLLLLSSLTTNISKDVYFGNKMQYKQVFNSNNNLIGYDLYIS